MKSKHLLILLSAITLQSCVVPGVAVDPIQVSQTKQNKIFSKSKKGIVIFKGISCPLTKNGEEKEEGFFNNLVNRGKMLISSDCASYKFVSEKDENYYIKQLSDSSVVSKTYADSDYTFYTVPEGKYYYNFDSDEKLNNADLLKAFYFEVVEGHAVYVGDFYYNSKSKKFKIVDNYEAAKNDMSDEIPVPIEKRLAQGLKTYK